MIDRLGKELKKGQHILFATNAHSCTAHIRSYLIVSIDVDKQQVHALLLNDDFTEITNNPPARISRLERTDNMIIVGENKL